MCLLCYILTCTHRKLSYGKHKDTDGYWCIAWNKWFQMKLCQGSEFRHFQEKLFHFLKHGRRRTRVQHHSDRSFATSDENGPKSRAFCSQPRQIRTNAFYEVSTTLERWAVGRRDGRRCGCGRRWSASAAPRRSRAWLGSARRPTRAACARSGSSGCSSASPSERRWWVLHTENKRKYSQIEVPKRFYMSCRRGAERPLCALMPRWWLLSETHKHLHGARNDLTSAVSWLSRPDSRRKICPRGWPILDLQTDQMTAGPRDSYDVQGRSEGGTRPKNGQVPPTSHAPPPPPLNLRGQNFGLSNPFPPMIQNVEHQGWSCPWMYKARVARACARSSPAFLNIFAWVSPACDAQKWTHHLSDKWKKNVQAPLIIVAKSLSADFSTGGKLSQLRDTNYHRRGRTHCAFPRCEHLQATRIWNLHKSNVQLQRAHVEVDISLRSVVRCWQGASGQAHLRPNRILPEHCKRRVEVTEKWNVWFHHWLQMVQVDPWCKHYRFVEGRATRQLWLWSARYQVLSDTGGRWMSHIQGSEAWKPVQSRMVAQRWWNQRPVINSLPGFKLLHTSGAVSTALHKFQWKRLQGRYSPGENSTKDDHCSEVCSREGHIFAAVSSCANIVGAPLCPLYHSKIQQSKWTIHTRLFVHTALVFQPLVSVTVHLQMWVSQCEHHRIRNYDSGVSFLRLLVWQFQQNDWSFAVPWHIEHTQREVTRSMSRALQCDFLFDRSRQRIVASFTFPVELLWNLHPRKTFWAPLQKGQRIIESSVWQRNGHLWDKRSSSWIPIHSRGNRSN